MQNFLARTEPRHVVNDADDVKDVYDVACRNATLALENAQNDNERRHWSEVVRLCKSRFENFCKRQREAEKQKQQQLVDYRRPRPATMTSGRLTELQHIERKLERVAELTLVVHSQVTQQMSSINSIERNVDTLTLRLDSSRKELEDAAPRIYHSARRNSICFPRTMPQRIRFSFFLLAIFYFSLIALGII